jgi:hypothetical protein
MRLLPILLASTGLVGCVADDSTSVGSTTENLIAFNRLASNRLASNRLASNRLASNHLDAGRLALNTDAASELLATSDGQEVLTYLVSCALPSGTDLTAPDGTVYSGEIGVAPEWLNHPLDSSGQRWVSACMFSRVSDKDVAVPISMRGPTKVLTPDASEIAAWTLQQGAFYGELFGPASTSIEWVACQGTDEPAARGADRICAQPDPANPGFTMCGFIDAGPCGGVRAHNVQFDTRGACSTFDDHAGGFYRNCRAQRGAESHAAGVSGATNVFGEVITVYVHP